MPQNIGTNIMPVKMGNNSGEIPGMKNPIQQNSNLPKIPKNVIK
jgi:hypothetical protein